MTNIESRVLCLAWHCLREGRAWNIPGLPGDVTVLQLQVGYSPVVTQTCDYGCVHAQTPMFLCTHTHTHTCSSAYSVIKPLFPEFWPHPQHPLSSILTPCRASDLDLYFRLSPSCSSLLQSNQWWFNTQHGIPLLSIRIHLEHLFQTPPPGRITLCDCLTKQVVSTFSQVDLKSHLG